MQGECSFIYRYIVRESCSQFDSLPLTYLMNSLDLRAAVRAAPRAAPRERGERARRTAAATASRAVVSPDGELSFTYRYISRESCSQFDSLPLTSSSNADFARRSDLRTAPGAWGRWDRAARHRPRALSALTPPPSLALFSAPEPAAPRRGAHSERRANRCDVHAHLRRRARSRGGVHSVGAARSDAALTLPSAHAARHLRGLGRGIQRTLGIK